MLIAHLADTHLGLRQYGLHWRERDFYERFKEAVEKAVREGVDVILISGDMFDRARPPINALKEAIDALKIARAKGVPVYAVLGEHDIPKVKDIPPQFVIEGLKILGTSTTPYIDRLTIDGREWFITGISHRPPTTKGLQSLRRKLAEVSAQVSKNSVLMMHQNISNVFSLEPGLDLTEIPKVFKYVAMGHIHKRWVSKEPPITAYPGSLEIVKSDEVEEWRMNGKGFYLVDLSGDEPLIHKIDLDVTPQDIVSSRYPNHRRDVMIALNKFPKGRRGILHVKVCMPRNVRADPSSEIYAILKQKGLVETIYARVALQPCRDTQGNEEGARPRDEEVDEEAIIASLLGGNSPSPEAIRVAKSLVMLKNAIAEGKSIEDLEHLIESILSERALWSEKVRLPPLVEVAKALEPLGKASEHAAPLTVESEGRNVRRSGGVLVKGKGLESFMKREG